MERIELPLACTLSPGDGAERIARWRALAGIGRPTVRRERGRLEVRYRDGAPVRAELAALVAAERECCAFVEWSVERDGDDLLLRVSADPARPDNVAALDGLFDAD